MMKHHKPNLARNGAPKKMHPIEVAHGHRATDHAGATITKPTVAKRTAGTPLGEAIMRQAHGDGSKC